MKDRSFASRVIRLLQNIQGKTTVKSSLVTDDISDSKVRLMLMRDLHLHLCTSVFRVLVAN